MISEIHLKACLVHTNWCVLIEISMEIVMWLFACATVRETHFSHDNARFTKKSSKYIRLYGKGSISIFHILQILTPCNNMEWKAWNWYRLQLHISNPYSAQGFYVNEKKLYQPCLNSHHLIDTSEKFLAYMTT